MKNKYEKLFDEFLALTDFKLIKYEDGFGVIDLQGADLGDISEDRFESAEEILDRMDIYINDYFLNDIDDLLGEKGIKVIWDSTCEEYLKHAKELLPEEKFSFDMLDMICYHSSKINLNNCEYKEE